jgi:hypothetical protein
MEKYVEVLKEILLENDELFKGLDEEFLKQYFEIIEKLNFQEIIINSDIFNEMIDVFEEKYCFKRYMVAEDASQKYILRKLIHMIKIIAEEDSKKLELLLPLIIYLDYKNILSTDIFLNKGVTKKIKIFCLNLLRKFHINIDTPNNLPEYDYEARMFEKYKSNFDKLDFENIYGFIDSIERGGRTLDNPFLTLCSYIIINNSVEDYIKVLNEKEDALEIKLLIEKLSNTEKVKIGMETSNLLVKFEVIRELMYFNTNEIGQELIPKISKIIIEFTNDSKLWRQFIKYYLAFPSRSPKFFTSLGIALPKVDKEAVEIILQEIRIDSSTSMESRSAINNCFSEKNLENIIKDSAKIIYDRWLQYIEASNSIQIIFTDVIDIIIFYIVYIMEVDEFESNSKNCIRSIKEINNIWFKSKVDQRSFYYKNLSILFALGFRFSVERKSELVRNLKTSTFIEGELLELIETNWNRLENSL